MSLHEDIVEYIRSGETDGQALGLEVEHFVVNDEGVQIGFDEVTSLIKHRTWTSLEGALYPANHTIHGKIASKSSSMEKAPTLNQN